MSLFLKDVFKPFKFLFNHVVYQKWFEDNNSTKNVEQVFFTHFLKLRVFRKMQHFVLKWNIISSSQLINLSLNSLVHRVEFWWAFGRLSGHRVDRLLGCCRSNRSIAIVCPRRADVQANKSTHASRWTGFKQQSNQNHQPRQEKLTKQKERSWCAGNSLWETKDAGEGNGRRRRWWSGGNGLNDGEM